MTIDISTFHGQARVVGLRVVGEFERAVRNHNPRGAPDARLRAGILVDDALGGRDGGAEVLHLVLVIGGRSQDRRGLFVLREGVGKFQRSFRLHRLGYARETIAKICSLRVALATAIISQTGS